jgi:hypothetical protein
MTSSPFSPQPRTVLLVLDRSRVWRWTTWLAKTLADDGCNVAFQFIDTGASLPSSLQSLMRLEGLIFAAPSDRASALLDDAAVKALPRADARARYNLAIDFIGHADAINADRVVRPVFDGVGGDAGAIDAVLERRGPRLGLMDSEIGFRAIGTCALEHPEIFTRGLDGVFSRMAGLLLQTARSGIGSSTAGASAQPRPASAAPTRPLAFFAGSLARKASARLTRLLGQAPRWYVAWRRGGVHAALDIAWQDFTPLPDGGKGYFADPFVLMRGDTAHAFCEEVPFATGKGIISHFTIDAEGRASQPRPVLERPYHLSYPFVFERGGEVWMIPESSSNRTVELYRAEHFPDRWVKEADLLDGVLADDATLLEHDGKLWMFASVRDWPQASSWEALGLFHADALEGPWQAHAGNPVLLDPTAARPAGALFRHNGALIRPAQDCREGYGAGLAFARVDRLDEQGFAQTVVVHVAPRTRRTTGLHTYNRAGGVEVIDLYGVR